MSGMRRVLGLVARNRELRRVELAFFAFNAAEWGAWIAMLVYAYDRGGATEAGIVALAQLAPAALLAHRTARLPLHVGYVLQALALAATAAVLLAGGPALLAYACAALAATAVTATRPAQAAVVPCVARTPEELLSANVVAGWVESVSLLAGPALTGVLLSVGSPGLVFVVMAVTTAAAAVVVAPLRSLPETRSIAAAAESADDDGVWTQPNVRLLVGLLGAEAVLIGALDVLFVVLAVDQLDLGGAAAGYLNAAFGAGGVAALALTAGLVGRRRLAPPLLAAALAWVAAFALLALAPTAAGAFLLLFAAGTARSIVDVSGRTLLQRSVPPHRLTRTFGSVESVSMGGLAAGSLLAPALVALGGSRGAFAGVGALLLVAAAAVARRLAAIDRAATVPVTEIALLRAVPMFAPLDPPPLEALARSLEPRTLDAGETLIRQGDLGADRYYVVADGILDVEIDGARVREVRRGDGVGELALLVDVPRTATVTARTPAHVHALAREAFLRTVTDNPRSAAVAEQLVHERLPGATLAR
jgi:hypothetical protein